MRGFKREKKQGIQQPGGPMLSASTRDIESLLSRIPYFYRPDQASPRSGTRKGAKPGRDDRTLGEVRRPIPKVRGNTPYML